jgi:hypothetical protein
MRFSAKMVAISIGVALILGFLLGFIPEQRKNSTATSERDTAQSQLVTVQKEADLSSFKVRAAMTYIQAEKKNFSNASSSASNFFTACRRMRLRLPIADSNSSLNLCSAREIRSSPD